jgi:hypothetical protein
MPGTFRASGGSRHRLFLRQPKRLFDDVPNGLVAGCRIEADRLNPGLDVQPTVVARLPSVWPQPISIDDIAPRKAASSASEASRGVERRVSSVPRPIPACRSRVTVMAIRAGHGPGADAGAHREGPGGAAAGGLAPGCECSWCETALSMYCVT